MDTKNLFDAFAYFQEVLAKNKLATSEKFEFCRISGPKGMEDALANFRTAPAFFCVDDSVSGMTYARNGGFFQRRIFTLFAFRRYDFKKQSDRAESLSICRKLSHQLLSKMIVDSDTLNSEMVYIDLNSIKFQEIEQYALSGCAGLYFLVAVDEPINLVYDDTEWEQ